jgi:protein-S-isoprenylcysteine O-methyltransferase Ste14
VTAAAMTPAAAKVVWVLGCIAWYVIRYPHQRRSRRTPVATRRDRRRDMVLMVISASGLGVVPALYVATRWFAFADYPFHPLQAWLGVAVLMAAHALFYRTHRDLGRAWSVTLAIRAQHRLVTHGVYARLRHPMYAAFWLWAASQALLLPNWIAGFSGLVGFGTLFFGRVGLEERMMLETFGAEYRDYMARTKRVVPGVY